MKSPKIVWVNGCFDILHIGHIQLLQFAKKLGGKESLILVGIDSDEKIKKDKGSNRPFNNAEDRKRFLLALRCVDFVYTFDSKKGLEDLIKSIKPDIMVVGSDYKDKEVVGSQFAGKVEFFDRIPGYSTTKILEGK